MRLEKQNLLGNPFIGVFSATNDKLTLLPAATPDRFSAMAEDVLKTKPVRLNLCNSPLIGIFSVFNNNGIVVPEMAFESELDTLGQLFDNVATIRQFTAIGNLAASNDNGCVASPILSKAVVETLESTLGVPVTQTSLAGLEVIGSSIVATSKGFLANMNASDDEIATLEKAFGVEGDVGSINYGVPFVKSGLIANKNGAITGLLTSPHELGRIDDALFLGRE